MSNVARRSASERDDPRHAGGSDGRPVRELHRSWFDQFGDAMAGLLARAGVGPFHLLTTRGRKTGRPRTNPVVVVQDGSRRWVVAPYGPVSWVLNARAAGRVTLRRGRDKQDYTVRELPPQAAGPVLKRYVAVASATRPYFESTQDSPIEDFIAEAHRHPVFELRPLDT